MGISLKSLDLNNPLRLDDLIAWMDGGSVTLDLIDSNANKFSVEFCQTMFLEKLPYSKTPGSFWLNGEEVPIRSTSENALLKALRSVLFDELMPAEEQAATKAWIQELIGFIESEEYLRIAAAMGRIPK